nr:MAG: phosphoprotein [Taraxacum betanucleorhabdovirus 1]
MNDANRPIHPRYADLPSSVQSSEVLTSNYMGVISAAGKSDIQGQLIKTIEELSGVMQKHGLSCPDEALEVFSEVIIQLDQGEDKEIVGRMLNSLLQFGGALIKQTVIPASVIEKMSVLADSMTASVYELKDVTTDLKDIVPRKMLRVARNKRDQQAFKSKIKTKAGQGATSYDNEEEEEEMECEAPKPDVGEITLTDKSEQKACATEIDKATYDIQRRNCREHYWSQSFEALPPDTKTTLVSYYINHILHVNPNIMRDPDTAAMLYDLINKDTIIAVLNKGKAKTLTNEDISNAVEELVDAIRACGKWYGDFSASSYLSGEIHYLGLIKGSTK